MCLVFPVGFRRGVSFLATAYTCWSKYIFDRTYGQKMSFSTGSGFVPGKSYVIRTIRGV